MPELLPAIEDHTSLAATPFATYNNSYLSWSTHKILTAHTFKVTVLHDNHAAGKATEGKSLAKDRTQESQSRTTVKLKENQQDAFTSQQYSHHLLNFKISSTFVNTNLQN